MADRRALMPLEDLRRVARVAREEGVAIRARREIDGAVTFLFDPMGTIPNEAGDLDDRLAAFGAS
jgi:hypothetical protein